MTTMPDVTRYFHPVLAAHKLGKKPLQVLLAGRKYALWRDASGRPAAVADACPHRHAPLSRGRVRSDGRLACAYHGWNFDAEGRGRSPSQPTLTHCDTTSYQIIERYGYLWMASRETPLEAMPEVGCEGYQLAGAFSTRFEAPLHITLDNFTEDEHFAFVHNFLGWDESGVSKIEYEAHNFDDHTEATYIAPQRRSPFLPLIGVKAGDNFHNTFVTRFDPVHTVYTSHWTDRVSGKARPLRAKTWAFMLPETERTTRFHTFVFAHSDDDSLFRFLMPVVRLVARTFVWSEWLYDARWVRHMADTAPDLKGLRLGKFDKTVIRNRKFLETVYFGSSQPQSQVQVLAAQTEH
jgi:phenylpropionate dioxygenase-like ring-hydroxylating dioxygenase large terminal subunit